MFYNIEKGSRVETVLDFVDRGAVPSSLMKKMFRGGWDFGGGAALLAHEPPRVAAVKSVLDAKPAVTLQFSLLLSLSTIVGNMPVKLEM